MLLSQHNMWPVHVLLENVEQLGWPPGVFIETVNGTEHACHRCAQVSCWAVTICDGALFYPSLCAFLPRFETLVMLAVQRHQEARLAAHYARFLADGAPVLEFEVTAADVPALQQFLTLFGLARRLQAPRTADESAETELDA